MKKNFKHLNTFSINALKHFFDQRTVKEPSSETLLRLAELVLTLNCFSFAGNYYKQINGVAMGTRMGPSYANLFVGYVEHQFFNQYNGPKPELYGRYIDDCIGAISSSREELDQFITSVNSFHPALKYTWEISETSLAFLDIKVSIRGNVLCTSVHYKPTDSHSYLLYSSSHPSHVKNSIPYSQFLRLRRLCSDDSDFSSKSEEMCQFFEKRGYPVSVVKAGHHRAQQFDRQSSLQTSQKDKNDRIPFTLTFHPHNHAVKSIILSNFKLLQNDPETGRIFSQPPLISFKRDKNVGNFLVRSALKTNEQPGTFKCARSRCKTCLFIVNTSKISGPKRSVKITERFTCTSANVIYCITCTLCNKLYIGETGRRLGDRFREHLRDVEKNDKDASKPVARHFNLPNHSKTHMAICGLSLHLGTTESRKNLEQKFMARSKRSSYIKDLSDSCFKHQNRLWSYVHRLTNRSHIPDAVKHDDISYSNPNDKAVVFNNYFLSSFNTNNMLGDFPSTPFTDDVISCLQLSNEDVLSALKSLNPNKSPDLTRSILYF